MAKAVLRADAPSHTVTAICDHEKWSLRRDVRVALLRNEKTPMSRAVEFAHGLPAALLHEILRESKLPVNVKEYLLARDWDAIEESFGFLFALADSGLRERRAIAPVARQFEY